jgi:hypothetical protein
MEIIIFIAVVVGAALLWNGYVKAKKADSDQIIDNWQPPKAEDKPWPYGEKVAEGKIHVKTTDVSGSANRVEAPAPVVTNSNPTDNVPVAETKPAKKPAAKKTAVKPAAAKKAPAKKKSV